MQEKDPLSAFLHTDAWAAHSGGQRDSAGNIFTKHALPLGGHYWRSTRCFLPEGWEVPEFARDGWFVRLQPDSEASATHLTDYCQSTRQEYESGPAVQPEETLVVDLTQSEEDLLAGMHQKHRYNIRLAKKNGVTVELVSHNLTEALPRFLTLLEATTGRQGFRAHTAEHYQSIIKHLEPAGMARLVFARHDNRDIAAALIITCNNVATYLHGGSSYADRALMGPQLLHWEVMKALKSEGCQQYDFWGVKTKDDQPIPDHPSYGTTRFKLGFGGQILRYPPTNDLVLNRFCYTLYRSINRLRSRNRAFS